jgi:hypothetical protein
MVEEPFFIRSTWWLLGTFATLLVLGCLVAVWPTLTVALAVVVCVTLLALRAPDVAFVVSVLLLACEGSLKALLANEGFPMSVSTNAVAAALLDLCVAVSVLALLYREGPRAFVGPWRDLSRPVQIAFGVLGAWLAWSAIQVLVMGSFNQGVHGFRLVQAYAVVGVAGAILLGRMPETRLVRLMLGGFFVISAYAVFRLIVGPSTVERAYNLSRAGIETYGGVGRVAGSFSAAVGLASFLTPAAIFALMIGLTLPRYRLPALTVFVLSTVAVIASYVRTGIVALVAGTIVGGVLLVAQGRWTRRHRWALVGAVAALLAASFLGTAIASLASTDLRSRAEVFIHPLRDESLQLRFDTWRATLDDVRSHPLGRGVGSVGRASAGTDDDVAQALRGSGGTVIADNSYLKVLHEQGWPGGLLFTVGVIGVLVALGVMAVHGPRQFSPVGLASLAGAASFFVLLVGGEFVEQPGKLLGWFLVGLAALELGRARREPPSPADEVRASLPNPVGALRRIPAVVWIVAAVCLVALPVALTVARGDPYSASIGATTRGEHVEPAALAASMRRLLRDPVVATGIVLGAHADLAGSQLSDRLVVTATRGGVLIRIHGRTAGDARRRAVALVGQLAQEASRDQPFRIVLGPVRTSAKLDFADRIVDRFPGSAPGKPDTIWVALAGVLTGLLLCTALAFAGPDTRTRTVTVD